MKQDVEVPAVSYDADFYSWTQQTAELIQQGRTDEVDLEHVAEEIADMGKRDRRELRSRLILLLRHLLKWQMQPALRSASWRSTTVEQRIQIALVLSDSPSLRRIASHELTSLYLNAVRTAVSETGLAADTFPPYCPYSLEQMLGGDFFPDDPLNAAGGE
jgi:hypothetical protein